MKLNLEFCNKNRVITWQDLLGVRYLDHKKMFGTIEAMSQNVLFLANRIGKESEITKTEIGFDNRKFMLLEMIF